MIISILFIISFIGGLITSFSFENGVRILFLDFVVGMYGLLFILQSPKRNEAFRNYLSIFGPFIAIAITSVLLSNNPISLLYIVRFVAYSLLTISVSYDNELKKNVLKLLWSCGVMIALLGLGQYFLYPNLRNIAYLGWDPHQFRIFSTLFDPNFTGIVLVLTLILSNYLYKNKNTFSTQLILLGSGFTLIALLLTYSRGSFVALIAGLILFTVRQNRFKLLFGLSALFVLLLVILPRPGGEGVNLLRTISIGSRIENSNAALGLFWSSPIYGTGTFTSTVHNGWLYILATTGIVGFFTYLWIWWKLLKSRIKNAQKNPHFELLLVSFVAIGIHSIFDNILFYPHVMFWMWMLSGVFFSEKSKYRL